MYYSKTGTGIQTVNKTLFMKKEPKILSLCLPTVQKARNENWIFSSYKMVKNPFGFEKARIGQPIAI